MKKVVFIIVAIFASIIPYNQRTLAQGKTNDYEEVVGDKRAGPGGVSVCYCYQIGNCKCFIPKNPSLY